MKDSEIISVKSPQSQPKNSDKKVLPASLQESDSFEKKLKTSEKKLQHTDDELTGLIDMLAEMSAAAAGQNPEAFKNSPMGLFPEKNPGDSLISEIENGLKINAAAETNHSDGQNNPSGNPTSPALTGNKADSQQELLAQLLAYFKSTGIPFPVMDLVSKLENLNARPDIDLIAQKIVENANLIKINGKTELVLNLKPEWLGALKMSISSDNGTLTIQIYANGKTKELIESQLEELKRLLAASNLNVGSLNVSVGNQNSGSDSAGEGSSEDIKPGHTPSYLARQAAASGRTSDDINNIAMTMKRLMIYSKI